jgi:hypothetical protein
VPLLDLRKARGGQKEEDDEETDHAPHSEFEVPDVFLYQTVVPLAEDWK